MRPQPATLESVRRPRPGGATPRGRLRQRGLTLVEIMVALAISVLLMAGVIQIFISSKQTYNMQEGLSRLQENGRYAMERIVRDVSAGGYMGCLESTGNVINTLNVQGTTYGFANAISGTDNTGPGIGGASFSDTLSVSHATGGSSIPIVAPMTDQNADLKLDSTNPNYQKLQQYDVIAVSDCASAAVFMITNDPTTSGGTIQHATGVTSPAGSPNAGQSNSTTDLHYRFGSAQASAASTYAVATNTYAIGTSTAGTHAGGSCGTATPQYCALLLDGNELVEGVENLQVLYGEDTNNDGTADQYVTVGSVTNWNNVVSVRITLTLNTIQRVVPTGDGLVRKTFTRTIRLRNRV